ncbi:DUF3237 family protein [Rhizobacter sp. LjRoot28]|uniref:DUF3237 family protein n=1 Tax=Rhizobacter sp. LjRoot28 TaxID=3342309 RepID=UPI003ED07F7F
MNHLLSRWLPTACAAAFLMASSQPALTAVLAEQAFATGLGPYAASGSVSTGSYGARLRGGSGPGRLTGPAIDTTGHGRLRVTVERATSGLDAGEAATITATIAGQTRTLESTASASGAAVFELGDVTGPVALQFTVNASNALETFTVARLRLEGEPTPPCDGCEPVPSAHTIVPDPSWTCGLPGGIPDPARGAAVFTTTLAADPPRRVGATPYGQRHVTRTQGGTLAGGGLTGSVLPGALDFELLLPSGAVEQEARYTLRAPDQTLIYLRTCGVADGADIRFVAEFEAPSASAWQWLNRGTYVGRRQVTPQGIRLSVHEVSATAPPGDPVVRVPADPSLPQQAWNCGPPPAGTAQGSQVLQARVSIGSSQTVGESKRGRRNIIPITGGTHSGALGSGAVDPGGADHQLTVAGELQIEARYTVTAANGETVVVRNCGDFASGSLTAVGFEARTDGAHDALNRGRYVGTIAPGLGRVTITVYEAR